MKIRDRVFAIHLLILVLAAGLNVASAQTAKPDAVSKPTIVIVHGAWGGSWAFRQVEALLREKGFNVYRPQLTGLGERVHLSRPDIGLSTNIDYVVNTILYEDLHDVILMGHSYGGMVITGVADRVPDRIRRLVYVDAFVPNDGESAMSIVGARGSWLKDMTKGDYIVPAWVKPDQLPPRDEPQPLKTFTNDCPEEQSRLQSTGNYIDRERSKAARTMTFGCRRSAPEARLAVNNDGRSLAHNGRA